MVTSSPPLSRGSARTANTSAPELPKVYASEATPASVHRPLGYADRKTVGEILGLCSRSVMRLELDGVFTAHRFGRAVRYNLDEVYRWAASQAR